MYALAGLLAVFVLLFSGMPLGFAMTLVGLVGFSLIVGIGPAGFMAAQLIFDTALSYPYAALPLFILMGNLVAKSRLADEMFGAAYAFTGHRPGGLARATIMACAGFAAVCGSSLATAATMCRVAYPAMRARNYDDRLTTSVIAVGGTLGILIPPSTILLVYGLITQTDVAKLFAAGIVPGIIAVILHYGTVRLIVQFKPEYGPVGERSSWSKRLAALNKVWAVAGLFLLIVGGIVGGVFTATEGGGIGAAAALFIAVYRRLLSWRDLAPILLETGRTTAMIFFVLFGALILSNFFEVTGLPRQLEAFIKEQNFAPIGVLFMIVAIYIVLGCFLESVSMIFLTIPLFFPIITSIGYDPIWFGVLVVVVVELGLITPPVGLNIFVMKGLLPDVPLGTMFAGIMPFIGSFLILILILILVPSVATVLPNFLFR